MGQDKHGGYIVQAYRIVNWNELAELNSKGKPAKSTDKSVTKKRPQYVRWAFQSHSLNPVYKRLTKKAYSVGKMMEAATMGLYAMLMDVARDFDDPKSRGWILDDLKRPMDAYQIAEFFEIRDKEHVSAALELLCDPEIGLLEFVDFDVFPRTGGKRAGLRGIEGEKSGKKRKEENCGDFSFRETETEIEIESLNLNETERDPQHERGPHREDEDFPSMPAPPSDSVMDSDSVSDKPASVSDSVPRAGRAYSAEEVRRLRQIAGLKLVEILRPRTTGDNTTFNDILDQLAGKMIDETELNLFDMALKKARQCRRFDNPRGAFVAAMKKSPYNYFPRGTTTIKGALDHYRGSKMR